MSGRNAILTLCLVVAGLIGVRPGRAAELKPPALNGDLPLGPDDRLSIWVRNAEDLSKDGYLVDRTGEIQVPLVGRIHVAGQTAKQVEAALAARFAKYIREPQVAVSLTARHSQPVSIVGSVVNAGTYQLAGQRTLLEMLTVAGGLRPDAGAHARITRLREQGALPLPNAQADASGRFSMAEVNLRALMASEGTEENVELRPHDIVAVPTAQLVYVIGEVSRQGSIPLSESGHVSALQALSLAGGLSRAAAPQRARILRLVMGGPSRAELPVDLRRVLAGKSNDIPLMPHDILFIPDSSGKRVAARAVEAGIQAGMSFLTFGVIVR